MPEVKNSFKGKILLEIIYISNKSFINFVVLKLFYVLRTSKIKLTQYFVLFNCHDFKEAERLIEKLSAELPFPRTRERNNCDSSECFTCFSNSIILPPPNLSYLYLHCDDKHHLDPLIYVDRVVHCARQVLVLCENVPN